MKLIELATEEVKQIYKKRLIYDFISDEQKPLDVILKAIDEGIYKCLG